MGQHNAKHHTISLDNIKVHIGTMDKTRIETVFIDLVTTIDYTDSAEVVDEFEESIRETFKSWLYNQTEWNRRRYIVVLDHGDANKRYKGYAKAIKGNFNMVRQTVTDWKSTVKDLMPLVNDLIDTVKETCCRTGVNLHKWKVKEPTKADLSN